MPQYTQIDVKDLPAKWQVAFFGDLAEFRIGRTPARNEEAYWSEGVYPWVSIADMKPFGTITHTKERVSEHAHRDVFKQTLVPAGSILMSFKLTIGRMAKLGVPAYHNEAIISFMPDQKRIDPDYLFYYLGQIDYRAYQDTAVKGQTLNKSKLERLEIALPPLAEQRQIASVMRMAFGSADAQRKLLSINEELNRTLLSKLMTGELRAGALKASEFVMPPSM